MSVDIKLIILCFVFIILGVWFFLAGLNGWKYPRLRSEWDDDNEKIIYQILKIIIGIVLIICAVRDIIMEFIN